MTRISAKHIAALAVMVMLCPRISTAVPVTNEIQNFDSWPGLPQTVGVISPYHVNYTHVPDGWKMLNAFMTQDGTPWPDATFPPADTTLNAVWLQDTNYASGSCVVSSYRPNGVGAIAFRARTYAPASGTNFFNIEVSTNGTLWDPAVASGYNNNAASWSSHEFTINDYRGVYVRILKTGDTGSAAFGGASGQLMGIDTISLTKPPATVAITNSSPLPSTVLVSQESDITVEITPMAEASNLTVRLYYSIGSDSSFGSPILMTNGVDNSYTTVSKIPAQTVSGTPVYYYVKVEFEGPQSEDTNPQYYPAGGAASPTYYVVRAAPLTSTFTDVAVTDSFATNLTLVRDNEWQGVATVSSVSGANFHFTADAGAESWGETNQPFQSLPVFGNVETNSLGPSNILLGGTSDGHFAFRFNETNLKYSAQQVQYVNFNDWGSASVSNDIYTNADWVISGRTTTDPGETNRAYAGTGHSLLLGDGIAGGGGGSGGVGYRADITFTNFDGRGVLTNFPVLVILSKNPGNVTIPLGNNGFELPNYSANGWAYLADDGQGYWSFSGGSVGGIANNGSPWFTVAAPEGDQGAFIQGDNQTMSQAFTVTTAGNYRVSFQSIGRGGANGPAPMAVEIDGNKLFEWKPGQASWTSYETPPVGLSTGAHTIAFRNLDTAGDYSSCIDDVAINSETNWGLMYDEYTFLRSDGYDLRFYDSDETELKYEIEEWSTNGSSYVWVQVPTFSNNCVITARWADPAKVSQESYTTNGDVWSEGFEGVFHLSESVTDEQTGGSYDDSSPNDNAGSQNNTGVGIGVVGRCGDFDGDDYITVANESDYDFNDYITASLWIRTEGGWNTSWQMFLTKGQDQHWDLRRNDSTEQVEFILDNDNAGCSGPATNMANGQWHHFVGVYRQSDGTSRSYIDGELYHIDPTPDTSLTLNNEPLRISGRNSGGYNHRGQLDEVRVSRAYRSEHWIWASYQNQGANHQDFADYGAISNTVGGGGATLGASSVVSPFMTNGIGEISFWYRNWWNETNFAASTFVVERSSDGVFWTEVDRNTNVLSSDYLYYSKTLFDPDSRYLRITGPTNAAEGRLLLDEIIVAEPGPGVTFSGTQHTPSDPYITDQVDVETTLSVVNNASELEVLVWYRAGTNGSFISTVMTNSGSFYKTDDPIPRGPAGPMQYYVECTFDSMGNDRGSAFYPNAAPMSLITYTNTESTLVQDFDGWPWAPTVTVGFSPPYDVTYTDGDGWSMIHGFLTADGTPWPDTFPIAASTPNACWLQDYDITPDAEVRTPSLDWGIGYVSFSAKNFAAGSSYFTVQTSQDETNWTAVVDDECTNILKSDYVYVVNDADARYLRIIKTGDIGAGGYGSLSGQPMMLDDIIVTYPPATVSITNVITHPGYPSADDPTYVSCTITSATPAFRAFNLAATLWYRAGSTDPYSSIPMTADGSRYQSVSPIPVYPVSTRIEYYIEVTFDGYYGAEANKQSPSYYPAGTPFAATNHFYAAPSNNPAYFDVRGFRSSFSSVAFNSSLGVISNSSLVDAHTWQSIYSFGLDGHTNSITFDFLAFSLYTNGAPTYSSETNTWGGYATTTYVPCSGDAVTGAPSVTVTGDFQGTIVFQFDTENEFFVVRRGVYQDFDNWNSASTEFFDQSLDTSGEPNYKEETFDTWPLSAIHVTSRDTADLEDFEGWSGSTGQYYHVAGFGDMGFQAVWYWIRDEVLVGTNRAMRLKDDATFGKVWPYYSTLPRGLGSYTFKYRWASYSNEHHDAYYSLGTTTNWNDYCIRATLTSTNLSPEFPYLAIVAKRVDKDNMYEYRLQKTISPTNNSDVGLTGSIWKRTSGFWQELHRSEWFPGYLEQANQCRFLVVTNNNGDLYLEGTCNDIPTSRTFYYDDSPGVLRGDSTFGFHSMDANIFVDDVSVCRVDAQRFGNWDETDLGTYSNAEWVIDSGQPVSSNSVSLTNSYVKLDVNSFDPMSFEGWPNDGWGSTTSAAAGRVGGYKMKITFDNFAGKGPETNFPMLVKLSESLTGFNYSDFLRQQDGYDLRFASDDDLLTELPYEIEKWDTNGTSYIWVQVPVLTNNAYVWATWGDWSHYEQPQYTKDGSVWSHGFGGVWHLENRQDSSPYGNDGASSGAINTPSGMIGSCYDFDGSGDDINCGRGTSLKMKYTLTASAWFKATSIQQWAGILGKGNDRDYELEYPNTSSMRFRVDNDSGQTPTTAVSLNTWYYMVGTYGDGANSVKIYKDGVLQQTKSTAPISDRNELFWIGSRGGGNEHNGLIDEVRVSSVARSSNWIWACYMNQGPSHDTFSSYGSVSPAGGGPTVDGWIINDARIDGTYTYSPTNAVQLCNDGTYPDSYIRSPLISNGIGRVSFFARNVIDTNIYFDVLTSTNGSNWTQLRTVTNWSKVYSCRMPITFSGYNKAEALTNFPVLIKLDASIPNFSYADFGTTNAADLKFTDSAGKTLYHEIDLWDTTSVSYVWVRLNELASSNDYIYAYWGNPNITEPADYTTDGSVWSAGYKGVWHLGETNAMAQDSSPRAHHAISVNGLPEPASGIIGDANDFVDGDSDYIVCPKSSDFDIVNNFTVSAWVYDHDKNNWEGIVGNYNAGFILALRNSSNNQLMYYSNPTGWKYSNTSVPKHAWAQVAVVFDKDNPADGTDGTFYMNGIKVGSAQDLENRTGTDYLTIGAGGWDWRGYRFDGLIDEVRISRASRSTNWIWASYACVAQNGTFNSYGTVTNGTFKFHEWNEHDLFVDKEEPVYLKIKKTDTTGAGAYLVIDDIQITPPLSAITQGRRSGGAIDQITFKCASSNYTSTATTCKVAASRDGNAWDILHTIDNVTWTDWADQTVDVDADAGYRYAKIINDGPTQLELADIYVYGTNFYTNSFTIESDTNDWTEVFRAGGPYWYLDLSNGVYARPGYVGPATEVVIDLAPTNGITGGGEDPVAPWELDYDSFLVSNMQYATTSLTLNAAEETFIRIRHDTGNASVVLDDLKMTSWRGSNYVSGTGWSAYECWTSQRDTDDVALDLWSSRCHSNYVQYLQSPLMTNGIGALIMDYKCANGPVEMKIETQEEGTNVWITQRTMNISNTVWRERRGIAINLNGSYRLRLRHSTTNNDLAILSLDNVKLSDYVERDDTMWEAYNALITHTEDTREFEAGAEYQTCYLNNDPSLGTDSKFFDLDKPYLQTPLLTNGVGEISFWYRNWENSGSPPGTIILRCAPTAETPAADWTIMGTLENITNTGYLHFETNYYRSDDHFVRITCETNGTSRVCLDNVLVCEPMGANFDVVDVTLHPSESNVWAQPLYTDEVNVSCKLQRKRLSPSNITVRLWYHIGSDDWGQWGMTNSILMTTNGQPADTYMTVSTIPAQPIDTVVQYFVEATFEGEFASLNSPKRKKDFTNPWWYYPVNLNASETHQNPYYYSFSCLPRDVWINEFNVYDSGATYGNQYIELCGRQGGDIGGWTLDIMTNVSATNAQFTAIRDSYLLTNNVAITNEYNGYGFWVIGTNTVTPPPDMLLTNILIPNTAFRLTRSMGAYEHFITNDSIYGSSGSYDLPFGSYPVGLQGTGSKYTDFTWQNFTTLIHTPGEENDGQSLEDYTATQTLVVASLYGSSIAPPRGTNLYLKTDQVTCSVGDSPVEVGSYQTQYVCVGWNNSGSVPLWQDEWWQSPTSTGPFSILIDSSIEWLWQTNMYLNTSTSGGDGSVNTNGWFPVGSNVTVVATAGNYYEFTHWGGDTSDIPDVATNIITVSMNTPRTLVANFKSTDKTLEVISEQPGASPVPGIHTNHYNTELTCIVSNRTLYYGNNMTQYQAVGWIPSGSVPAMPVEGPVTNMQWIHAMPPPGTFESQDGAGWVTAIYRDGGNWVIDPLCSNGVSAGDDTLLVTNTIDLTWQGGLMWDPEPITIDKGLRIYTVIFNSTSISGATHYLAVDSNLFLIPEATDTPLPDSYYNCGTASSNDWSSLLSPTSLTLSLSTGPFNITTNSSIEWIWETNFYLNVSTTGVGTVTGSWPFPGWIPANSNVLLTGNGGETNVFDVWNDDTNGITPDVTSSQITFQMTAKRYLTAAFVPGSGTSPMGTPYSWLALHFGSNLDYWDTNDWDGDLQVGWQEYIAGTDPTNLFSSFRILRIEYYPPPGDSNVVWYYATTNTGFTTQVGCYKTTNLLEGWGVPYEEYMGLRDPDGTGTNVWVDNYPPETGPAYYKLYLRTTNGPQ